jgi:hypothetical protein
MATQFSSRALALPAGGASLVFNYTTFTGATPITSNVPGGTGTSGGFAYLTDISGTDGHQAGTLWNTAQVNIQSFTTNFTFTYPQWDGVVITAGSANITIPSANNGLQNGTSIRFGGNFGTVTGITSQQLYNASSVSTVGGTTTFSIGITPGGTGTCTVTAVMMCGMSFSVQTSNLTTQPGQSPFFGTGFDGDANYSGHSGIASAGGVQFPLGNSLNINLMTGNAGPDLNSTAWAPGQAPNSAGLFINGGPFNDLATRCDLNPYGFALTTGNVMKGTVVYDGSHIDLTILNTVTGAQARMIWPLSNLTSIVGGNTAWVGFTQGMLQAAQIYVRTWDYSTGFNQRLTAPVFSPLPGSYTTTQTVSISASPGATIYYSTNGLPPTSSSTQYTGAITVSATQNIQAVAIQSGFTPSFPSGGVFQIATGGTPAVNFPSGFSTAVSSGQLVLNGNPYISGSNIQLILNTGGWFNNGALWTSVPQPISTFSTTFSFTSTGHGDAGFTFCLQNYNQSATSYNNPQDGGWVSGGPSAIIDSNIVGSMGYAAEVDTIYGPNAPQIVGFGSSICVAFDMSAGSFGGVGMYSGGAVPSGSTVSMSSSMNLSSGQVYTAALTYNGTTLSLLLTNTVTSATYSTSWTVNIPALVGASTAYAGFTGASGFNGNANIQLTNWTM